MINKILICTHKQYVFSKDSLYIPIQLGCDEYDFDLGIQKDNTGDNISYKHRFYSEFSGLYWAWKNMHFDYLGICHYRRYFIGNSKNKKEPKFLQRVLKESELNELISKYPDRIFVAKKRKYYIETIYSHYCHTHNKKDIDLAIKLMKNKFNDYYDSFMKVLNGTSAHMFNAFIMDRNSLNSYCSFLFDYLFEYENIMDVNGYNEYESRLCGYIGELLLESWMVKNSIKFVELKYAFVGKKHLFTKLYRFLKHKFIPSSRTFNE